MARITVGRGIDCDIVIPDEKDNVSRHHMVITFDFFGKMKVSDTSSNGTFINGKRMLKGTSIPVKRSDEIRLGDSWIFDWKQVRDPYKNIRKCLVGVVAVLLLVSVGVGVWQACGGAGQADGPDAVIVPKGDTVQDDSWNKDSTEKVAPTATSVSVDGKAEPDEKGKAVHKKSNKKKVNKGGKSKKADRANIRKVEQKDGIKDKMPVVN